MNNKTITSVNTAMAGFAMERVGSKVPNDKIRTVIAEIAYSDGSHRIVYEYDNEEYFADPSQVKII